MAGSSGSATRVRTAMAAADEPARGATYKPVTWTRWPNFEAAMAAQFPDVRYAFRQDFPVSRIDADRSRNNQVRLEAPIDEDQVETLLVSNRLRPLELPALVGRSDPQPRGGPDVVLADGNHRDEFGRRRTPALTSVSLYELMDVGSSTFSAIAGMCNALVGRTTKSTDRLIRAVAAYRDPSNRRSQKELADVYTVSVGRLGAAIRADELRTRLSPGGELAIPGYRELVDQPSVLQSLAKIDNDNVLKTLADGIARRRGLSGVKVADIVAAVRSRRTERDQLAEVEAQLGALPAAGPPRPGGKKLPPAERLAAEFSRSLTSLRNVTQNGEADLFDLFPDAESRARLLEVVIEFNRTLGAFRQKLARTEPAGR